MSLKIIGKVTHYPTEGEVKFGFNKYYPKEKKKEGLKEGLIEEYNSNLAFEIWKKFKNSEVVITVNKK